MQWEEHNFVWLSVWSPQQSNTVKNTNKSLFLDQLLKARSLQEAGNNFMQNAVLFTLLIAPYTSIPSFLLLLPVQAIETCRLIQNPGKYTKLSFDLMSFRYLRPKLTQFCSQPICGNKLTKIQMLIWKRFRPFIEYCEILRILVSSLLLQKGLQ